MLSEIFGIIIGSILFIAIPGFLTVWNIINCFRKKPKLEKLMSTLTILIGGVYYALALLLLDLAGDWYEVITTMQLHYPISSDYWWMGWFIVPGIIGYFILLYVKADKLPPLISILSIAALILLNVFQLVFAKQLIKGAGVEMLFFGVYHFNVTLLSARVICRQMRDQVAPGIYDRSIGSSL